MKHDAKHQGIRALGGERGAQVVEFAIILPIFLMLVMGMIDFGRGYFSWIVLTNAAREGARAAAVGWDAATIYDTVELAITGLARVDPPDTGDLTSGACPPSAQQAWCIQSGYIDTNGDGVANRGEPVRVQVQYNFMPLVPVFGGFSSNSLTLGADSTMRRE